VLLGIGLLLYSKFMGAPRAAIPAAETNATDKISKD